MILVSKMTVLPVVVNNSYSTVHKSVHVETIKFTSKWLYRVAVAEMTGSQKIIDLWRLCCWNVGDISQKSSWKTSFNTIVELPTEFWCLKLHILHFIQILFHIWIALYAPKCSVDSLSFCYPEWLFSVPVPRQLAIHFTHFSFEIRKKIGNIHFCSNFRNILFFWKQKTYMGICILCPLKKYILKSV